MGLRREAPIVLPLALALFAALGMVTLASYRAAVDRFAYERESEALAGARRLAEEVAAAAPAPEERLARLLPSGAALALLDERGGLLSSVGLPEESANAAKAITGALADAPTTLGPERTGLPVVIALVPFTVAAERRFVRLDLPAPALAAQKKSLALLTPLVVVLSTAAAVVVALFFRALLRPYETLLARARQATGGSAVPEGGGDDLDFLLATFERALATLGAPAGDLAPLAGALGQTLDGGFLLLDPEGRVLVVTPAASELLGPASPTPGAELAASFAAEPETAAKVSASLAAGTTIVRTSLRIASGDAQVQVGLSAEPLRGEGGKLRGFLVVIADESEHRRTEARERLADGLAQLGELSAGVAHELRNGLAAMRGWIDLLARRRLEGEAAECLSELDRESRQLGRVVDDFLAFARPGTSRPVTADLVSILRRAANDPAFAGVEIVFSLEGDEAPIVGDPHLLERAFRNLIANAVAAQREAGAESPVEIALARAQETVRVEISDRGRGIPAEIRDRLFEPFVSARPGGVGLGLALARRIFVLHGGEIAAEAREPQGTRLRVELPTDTLAT